MRLRNRLYHKEVSEAMNTTDYNQNLYNACEALVSYWDKTGMLNAQWVEIARLVQNIRQAMKGKES